MVSEHVGRRGVRFGHLMRRVACEPGRYLHLPRRGQADRASATADLYLDLLMRTLTNWIYAEAEGAEFDAEARQNGLDWPPFAHTMIGLKRLENVRSCVEDVLATGVPGD